MLLISSCLAGVACRYDGKDNGVSTVLRLTETKDHVLACPEVLGGLQTPRTPCEIVGDRVINAKGEDCTEAFKIGAQKTLDLSKKEGVQVAILKSRSPSCGHGLIYDGSFNRQLIPGSGLTASLLIEGGVRVLNETMPIGLNILVAFEVSQDQKEQMINHFPEHFFTFKLSRDASLEDLQAADVIFGNPRSGQLKHCNRLKWLQLESAGFERYTEAPVLLPGVTLTNARGCYGQAVSEHMLAMTWMLLKKLHLYRDQQQNTQWHDLGTVRSLQGSKVLVVGAGDIGRHYGSAVKKMGATVIGIKRSMPEDPQRTTVNGLDFQSLWVDHEADFDALAQLKDFRSLAPFADVIALCAPDNAESHLLIDADVIDSLRGEVIIINAGRGSAIDQEAVVNALKKGVKLHLGLDVTSPEPLPVDHPLWQFKEVFITPHISGGSHLPATFERLVALCMKNLEAYTRRAPLENVIVKGENSDGAETSK